MTVAVLGLGHPDRADDAVGPLVARALRRRLARCPELDLRILPGNDPAELLDLDPQVRLLIVVDAIRVRARPGTLLIEELSTEPAAPSAPDAGEPWTAFDEPESGQVAPEVAAERTGEPDRDEGLTRSPGPGPRPGRTDLPLTDPGGHALSLGAALALARTLDRAPARTVLVGVAARSFTPMGPPHPAVRAAVAAATTAVLRLAAQAETADH